MGIQQQTKQESENKPPHIPIEVSVEVMQQYEREAAAYEDMSASL